MNTTKEETGLEHFSDEQLEMIWTTVCLVFHKKAENVKKTPNEIVDLIAHKIGEIGDKLDENDSYGVEEAQNEFHEFIGDKEMPKTAVFLVVEYMARQYDKQKASKGLENMQTLGNA